ncbi:hypothetical protein BH11MYX4_BH11MYX4_04990 [soil metagenome]
MASRAATSEGSSASAASSATRLRTSMRSMLRCITRSEVASSTSFGRAATTLKITRSCGWAIGARTVPNAASLLASIASRSNSVHPSDTSRSTPLGWWRTSRTRFCLANASAFAMRPTIFDAASLLMSAGRVIASPCTTTSRSVVMRLTPRAITATPPITIQGARVSFSAPASASSADSSRRSPRPRRGPGTCLNPCPSAPDHEDRFLAHGISRAWPLPERFERVERCECFRDGLLRTCAFHCEQLALADGRGRLAGSPPLNRCSRIRHQPGG